MPETCIAKNAFSETFGKAGRQEKQKTGFPIVFGPQNIRSLNNKVEDVMESLGISKSMYFP